MPSRLQWPLLLGKVQHYLLTLTIRGRTYRFSSRDLVIVSAEEEGPNPVVFLGGLAPIEFTDAIALGETGDARSIDVEVLFQRDTMAGWAALADASNDLGDVIGELALWREGDDFATRQVLLRGFVNNPAHGATGEPVTMQLVEDADTDRALLPPTGSQVGPNTWPDDGGAGTTRGSGLDEAWYPWPWGEPGRTFGTASMPALLVEVVGDGDNSVTNATVLFAGIDSAAAGAAVTLYNDTTGTSAAVTPSRATDGLGRGVVSASVAGGTLAINDGDNLWWGVATAGRGGVYAGRSNDDSPRSAGFIIGDLLRRSTVAIDQERLRSALPGLSGYLLDFWVNTQTAPLDILTDDILPFLPVTLGRSPFGVYPVLWRWDAVASDAIAEINPATRGGQRAGQVQFSSVTEVYNEWRIDFAPHGPTGDMQGHVVLAPRDLDADPDVEPHPIAFASWTTYHGPNREHLAAPPVTCEVTDDRSTARAMIEWQLWRGAQTRRTTQYILPQVYQSLVPGDVVLVTDAAISWTEQVCLVTSVLRAPGDTLITVETVSNWIRDATA